MSCGCSSSSSHLLSSPPCFKTLLCTTEKCRVMNDDDAVMVPLKKKVSWHVTEPLSQKSVQKSHGTISAARSLLCAILICASLLLILTSLNSLFTHHQFLLSDPVARFQRCSIDALRDTGLSFLDNVSPIPAAEFGERRNRLATALYEQGIDAFLVEPGYTFSYYANVSQTDWEPWEPEERPFLMIISPLLSAYSGKFEIIARTTFLAPSFEVERVKLLGMPIDDDVEVLGWEEHWDPYATLAKDWQGGKKIMVDEEMRDFIARGLSGSGFDVQGLSAPIAAVRETKSKNEIDILRAVNTGTVEAVRAMRACMYPGLTETQVTDVLDTTLRSAGLEPFFDIVLFDDNASNPHGGTNGSKILEDETFVLIDVGAHLYGYSSDICRTFFPPFFPKPSDDAAVETLSPTVQKKISIWQTVLSAQTASITYLAPNETAASVDIAARTVIEKAGLGDSFTHRVGHGIGIKAHESPYLNKGNTEVRLRPGMVFTSEPGVYLVGEFGVRHEDVFLVRGVDAAPEVLSGRRAGGPWDP